MWLLLFLCCSCIELSLWTRGGYPRDRSSWSLPMESLSHENLQSLTELVCALLALTLRALYEKSLRTCVCGRAADNTEDLPKQLFISRREKRLRERVLQKDIFRQPLKVSLESWKPAVNRGVHHCLLPFSSLTARAGHPDVNSLGFLRSCPSPSRVMGFPHPNSQSPGLEKGLRTERP